MRLGQRDKGEGSKAQTAVAAGTQLIYSASLMVTEAGPLTA